MFTGIVEEIGSVRRVSGNGLTVAAQRVVDDLKLGDSVAVNGVCLTAVACDAGSFTVEVMPETLRRTNLGRLRAGSRVNIERALSPNGRLGGHFVQGHVDGTGQVESLLREAGALILRMAAAPQVLRYIVEKGFIAVDGASLTIVAVDDRAFSVSLVAFTQQNTILSATRPGDLVNLEVDILGKYVERFVRASDSSGGVSEEFLARHGFL